MAIEKGYFARQGITPTIMFTPNSDVLRAGLADGKFEIAHGGVDNAVAMVEAARKDVVILMGGDGGMMELLVRPEIQKITDLKGRNYVVDAPGTAYSLLGQKIIKDGGLIGGKDYNITPLGGSESPTNALSTPDGAATMNFPPWTVIAKDRGAKSLGRTIDLFGPYQGTGMWVMRSWAQQNPLVVQRYTTAYIEGCRATLVPSQRQLTISVLQRELKLDQRMASIAYDELQITGSGLNKDCAFNLQGFKNLLAVLAEILGAWNGVAPPPDQYLDLSYYNRSLAFVKP
ncbi:MAG: ABC transporter substrate-binding protein [Limnohabitans sp.]|nr:ABC transporter substrate-binding protein [Limnohabitans sp.]